MNYETSYNKGWKDPKAWQKFVNAIKARDAFEIDDLIDANDAKAVDADIHKCESKDLDILTDNPIKGFEYGDDQHIKELKFLHQLAEMRDAPLEDCPNNSCDLGYRVPSVFLETKEVSKYKPEWDYMTEDASFNAVQNAESPREPQLVEGTTKILTGRDAASYVHKDSPIIPWFEVVDYLLAQGVTFRVEEGMVANAHVSRFASCGAPHMYGTLGEGLKRICPLSFREKWNQLIPRPEECSMELIGKYLPQTYAEGSPYHPSRNAMHYLAAAVLAELILLIFDRYHVLPYGRTVEEEVYLLRDNIGYWRCWAGVHYPSDQFLYTERAKILALRIIKERYRNA